MNNNLNLTDDELTLIVSSLQITIMGHEKYIQTNGDEKLDFKTIEAIKEMKKLYERLNKEYF